MTDTKKRDNGISESDNPTAERSDVFFVLIICIVFAPIFTLLLNEIYEDEGVHGVFLVLGGDLLYATTAGALVVWGDELRESIDYAAELLIQTWAEIDPSLVWAPWQAVLILFLTSATLLFIGYRGVYSTNDTYSEREGE